MSLIVGVESKETDIQQFVLEEKKKGESQKYTKGAGEKEIFPMAVGLLYFPYVKET